MKTNRNFEKRIDQAVRSLIRDIVAMTHTEIRDGLLRSVPGNGVGSYRQVGKSKKTAEEMRCRFVTGKHRCTDRSMGPRFHYLCKKHVKKNGKKK